MINPTIQDPKPKPETIVLARGGCFSELGRGLSPDKLTPNSYRNALTVQFHISFSLVRHHRLLMREGATVLYSPTIANSQLQL